MDAWSPGLQPGEAAAQVLRRVFGYETFRGLQAPAVAHVIAGGDALVLMPTGGGKSLCYQLPALIRPGLGLVVSPLIALMDDQVAALRQLGVAAGALHSELETTEAARVSGALADGTLKLLYVSPERLLMGGTLERLRARTLALIAIDEAHCVSAWGHEFRPDYRGLARLAQLFPGVPRLALTATADPPTRADVLHALDMEGAAVFAASFHRPNLDIAAAPKSGETEQLVAFLHAHRKQAGIVYCGSRAKTERTAQRLARDKLPAVAFHAGLAPVEKRAALARFRAGEPVIVVATIAFGMGIDRPDVRFVVHCDMPDSPESYYQQIGRAGRDGDPAHMLLLYGGEDMARARHWLAQSQAGEAQKAVQKRRLEAMIALAETPECRTRALLRCFGEEMDADCGHCDRCRRPARTFDGTDAARKVLSAAYRTGQLFGAKHLAAVLRGEATEAVAARGHDRLPLFGIGRDQPESYWRGIIRQLVARGLLQVKEGEFASLHLVPDAARPLLRGESTIMLHEEVAAPAAPRPRSRRRDPPPQAPFADGEAGSGPLFDALRVWRANEARIQGIPPYVIFHDTVLREIAAAAPQTAADLARVRGMGGMKLERYGQAVLRILKAGSA